MLREAFKFSYPLGDAEAPKVIKVEITDAEGVSWREAKKQLRHWYLEQAKHLRSITQKDYFGA